MATKISSPRSLLPSLKSQVGLGFVTASGASVTLAIDGAAPITLGENRSLALTDELLTPADPVEAAVTPPNETDSARLLAALESGDDPFGILEATAAIAGGPGGDDGGGSFTRLLRILESTTPLDLAYPRPGNPAIEDLTRLSGAALGDGSTPGTDPAPDIDPTPDTGPTPVPGPPELDFEDVAGTVTAGHNSVMEASGDTVTGTITVTADAGVTGVTWSVWKWSLG